MSRRNISDQLDKVISLEQKFALRKHLLMEKALAGDNVGDIIKAHNIQSALIDRRQELESKSYIMDPLSFNSNFGYKDRNIQLSYDTLQRMSNTSVIAAIHRTRINQVADFSEPQRNKYSTGFKIQLKSISGEEQKPTKADLKKIEFITEFITNCGSLNTWENDDFDTFVRKYLLDSLRMDQGCFEVITDKAGRPISFVAVDGSTMRVADTYIDENYNRNNKARINGYLPKYVQLESGNVTADFYPWEMCFGVRNPTTNIYNVGYGFSEQEILVNQITSILWGEDYNKRFFSQGSMPKGFIRVDGSINPQKLQEFRQSWNSMMMGLNGAHKTPVLEAGKIDWVDLHKSNNDMEFSNWIEFLIKIVCAIYCIDPAEINFPLSGGAEQKAMFEGNNEARLKHSKDKGLYPILKHLQARINKFIVSRIDPRFEFVFVGLDGTTETEELENDIKKITNFETLNEVRERRGLKALDNGDIVLNSAYLQNLQMQQQQMMMQGGGEEGGEDYDDEDSQWEDEETDPNEGQEDDNPFAKAFQGYLKGLRDD